jgi:hypothetical protein
LEQHEGSHQATAGRRREPTVVIGLLTLAVVIAAAAFLAGRLSAPDSTPASDNNAAACTEAESSMQEHIDNAQTLTANADTVALSETEQKQAYTEWRQSALIVTQNPSCFSVDDRAAAQQLLDEQDMTAAQNAAQCAAADDWAERSLFC